jgi:hypothetical protein
MKLDYTVEEEYRTHLQKVWLQVMDTADLNRLKLSQKKKKSADTQEIASPARKDNSLGIAKWVNGNFVLASRSTGATKKRKKSGSEKTNKRRRRAEECGGGRTRWGT